MSAKSVGAIVGAAAIGYAATSVCASPSKGERPQTWGERAEEAKPAASIGTMSASPPKADKPITLAKPESPTRPKPTGLDTAALEEKDAEFFKPDSPNKEVVQTTFWSRPMMAFDDDPVLSGEPVKLKAAAVDDGEMQAGQANGYGTVAVDLAAEAAKQKETMKALRKAQMDKPPPVAMKKNPVTGKMEKFESEALKDDLPDEEAEEGEIEIPVGDDY